jgi:outer membrane receptor protein involved in Fe transport
MMFVSIRSRKGVLLAATILGSFGVSNSGFAQTTTLPADSGSGTIRVAPGSSASADGADEIVVTGSRVARNGYQAPTPTTVLGADAIDARAPATIIEAIAELPALRNSSTATSAGVGNSGSGGQSFINLRGLGPNRSLVLLDGQRIVPSTAIATVDVATLPSALIDKIDVVTGGASAAYGSDAVSGVVNFVLNNQFSGLKLDVQSGITQYGDNSTLKASAAWGSDFGGRGHIIASAEYLKASGVGYFARPYSTYPSATLVANAGYNGTPGTYKNYILPNAYLSIASPGGVIIAGPLRDTEFLPAGQTQAFPTGQFRGFFQALSAPAPESWLLESSYLSTPLKRFNSFVRASWDVADDLSLYATGLYAESYSNFASAPPTTIVSGPLIIRADNAFLPASVASSMARLGLPVIAVGRNSNDWGYAMVSRENITSRAVVGLQGTIGNGWSIDVYGEYGANTQNFNIANNAIWSRVVQASDTVVNPANGQIVCRSTLTNPTNGCIPLNIFGTGSGSPAAIQAVLGTSTAVLKLEQKVLSASISGNPLSVPAGTISVAAGLEYREESADQTTDALSATRQFAIGNPQPFAGAFNVKEAFVEAVVPLLKGGPGIRLVEVNAAGRITDYSISGSVTTWKLGVNWTVVDGLRLRATRSRDIRAPNITELFTKPVQQGLNVIDPVNNTQYQIQQLSTGNTSLVPEEADTVAAGFVISPSFLPGFEASVDYYNVTVGKAIATLAAQDIVNRCFAGTTGLCSLVTRSNGLITTVSSPFLNLVQLKTDGLDIETSYQTNLGNGRLRIRALANLLFNYTQNDGVNTLNTAGDMHVGLPKLTGFLSVAYLSNGLQLSVDTNYVGGGRYDNTFTAASLENNEIPSRAFVDVQASYSFKGPQKRQIFFQVGNLFNTVAPPIFAINGGPNYPRTGRNFTVGFRFAM